MDIGQAVGWLVGWLTATSLLWSTFPSNAAPLRNAISAEFSMISTDILCMNILNDAADIALHSNGLNHHISGTKQAFALQT